MPKKFCCALYQLTRLTPAELKKPPFTVQHQDLKKFMNFMKKSFALQKQKPKKKTPQISDEVLLEILRLIQERERVIEDIEKLIRGEHDIDSGVPPQDTPKKWLQLLSKLSADIAEPVEDVVALEVSEPPKKIFNICDRVQEMSGRTNLHRTRLPEQIPNSCLFKIAPPPEVKVEEAEAVSEGEEEEEGESEEWDEEEEEEEGEGEEEGEEEEAEVVPEVQD